MKTNPLTRRCKRVLYSICEKDLTKEQIETFNQIKENDPYLNQICEEVVHYITYDLPLQPMIIEKIGGDSNVKR